jgi:hypothetical protein
MQAALVRRLERKRPLGRLGRHIMTVKPPKWCYYSNTTNAIYRGWMVRITESIYLYDAHVSTCLADVYEEYYCFGEVNFHLVRGFKMEQRTVTMVTVWVETCCSSL